MSRTRLLSPILLIAVLAATLLFAATAAAETKVGEASRPANAAIVGEADIVAASASYDSTSGSVTFNATTAAVPTENPEFALAGALLTVPAGSCNFGPAMEAGGYPVFEIIAPYEKPEPEPGEPTPPNAFWLSLAHEPESGEQPEGGPASQVSSGATTTLSATSQVAVAQPYNCAFVAVTESGVPKSESFLFFPLAVPPAPPVTPATPTVTPETKTVTPPPPASALLSLAKLKPLTAKAGKWTKVKLKVTNTGGTAAGPLQVKAKAPKGVVVKPGTTKLPALLPGQSWTVVLEVQLTPKAKTSSTISLTGTLPGLTATSSVVIRSAG
jgi:hypothetical protein